VILGKSAIRQALATGDIRLLDDRGFDLPEWEDIRNPDDPHRLGLPDPIALQPASIDLHLGNEWLVPTANVRHTAWEMPPKYTDSKHPIFYESKIAESYMIPAHGFVLVRTREVIGISDRLFAKIEGRSSVGRLGLIVETAGVVDSGFQGSVTLELVNVLPNPLLVHAGMRGCQITFARVEGSTEGGYTSKKYQGQVRTTGSLLHRDFAA